MLVVPPASQFQVRGGCLPAVRVRDAMMELEQAALRASTGGADKGAASGVASPDLAAHPGGNVARPGF